MFDIDASEFLVVGVVALLVIGPKDLPRVMRTVGQWVGRARGMARHVRAGFDTMVRESEIEEMNRRWQAENQAIIAATRLEAPLWPAETADPALPASHATDAWREDAPLGSPDPGTVPVHDGVQTAEPHSDPARP